MARSHNEETLRILDEVEDWPALIEQMMAYAVKLAQIEYKWRAGTGLPKGNEIKDVVFRTIGKLYSGERTWEPGRVPLKVWLRNNIRSEMNNLFVSAYTRSGERREIPLESTDDSEEEERLEPQDVEGGVFEHSVDSPEDALVEKENRREREDMIVSLYKAIEGDELLEEICYLILGGCERKPRILAERLSVSREEINNALRRLDRRVEGIAAEQLGGDDE